MAGIVVVAVAGNQLIVGVGRTVVSGSGLGEGSKTFVSVTQAETQKTKKMAIRIKVRLMVCTALQEI